MDFARIDDKRRSAAVLALAGLSGALTTASIGLALAGLTAGAPPYVSVLVSSALLTLNAAALWIRYGAAPADSIERLAACAAALAGVVLAGCAWSGGAILPLVWIVLLCMAATAAATLWIAAVPELAGTSGGRAGASEEVRDEAACSESLSIVGTTSAEIVEDACLTQRIVRRSEQGSETLEVEWWATFAAGEREVAMHLPVAPPLAAAPEVECEPLDGAEVEITVAAAYTYGVRLEVRRLGDCSAPGRAGVGILLRSCAQSAAA